VFATPTWVSGALGMPRNTFLAWNALAAIASTCTATLGAYGIGAAVLGQLSAKRGTIALGVAALTLIIVTVGAVRHRRSIPARQNRRPR
jgi:membrane protein DedA with SNARE-associated domain